jgi:hypothetical protein
LFLRLFSTSRRVRDRRFPKLDVRSSNLLTRSQWHIHRMSECALFIGRNGTHSERVALGAAGIAVYLVEDEQAIPRRLESGNERIA